MIKIRAREREQECLPKTYECYAYKTGFESAIETVDKNLLIGAKITICHNAASTSAGVLADFVPPGFCPPGPNPLADIVPRTISASRY